MTEEPLQVRELLAKLDIGSSVAEHDSLLERYFVETETFRALIEDRVDVIAGDKGTGKSALYQILSKRYMDIEELSDVEVVSAFNPAGTPVFQRLTETEPLSEADYINVWKSYFFALAGNWLLEMFEGYDEGKLCLIEEILESSNLRTLDDAPESIFSKMVNSIKRLFTRVRAVEASAKVDPAVELSGRLEFFGAVEGETDVTRFDHALRLINQALCDAGIRMWLAVDRLDEAFQGRPQIERPALRALLRCYLDIQEFDCIRLKLFVRRDLFARIIKGRFVNLTHINARKIEIFWDEADLYNLLYKRVSENAEFVATLSLDGEPADKYFEVLFPKQVDAGARKPNTWTWMMGRIGDANVRPPRNLIDIFLKAREAQLRREDRDGREYREGVTLLTPDAMKKALVALSDQRVEDTLIAEAGDYSQVIEKFRGGKAEHSISSLQNLLGEDHIDDVDYLQTIGFLEKSREIFKVPMLYRGGLQIRQGKAFPTESSYS